MARSSLLRSILWAVLGVVYLSTCATAGGEGALGLSGQGAWPSYGADGANSKYAPLDQINPDNVMQLQVLWRWRSVENALLQDRPDLWTMVYEATPLMIEGRLYASTSLSQVAALDAVTGQTLWVYDPEIHQRGAPPNMGFVHRGVAYWADGDIQRIFVATGDAYLIALDARTGTPVPEFGEQGRIDLTQGLRRGVDRARYGVSSPPVICRNVVIVGATIVDYPGLKAMPPGDVRGFDARTGQQRWIFHAVPQAGEPGVDTWEQESWTYMGNTNVWTVMSCDEALGYVYLPFSTPTNDYYGGDRPGDNLFAESLVALRAETGARVWHFQMVHHGLWDYDLPAAPNLVDLTVAGQRIKAVAQVSKQGFTYVFDRVTGRPVWPIEERPVPPSWVAGEKASRTQPFPSKPLPFEQQGITLDDLIDFTPDLQREARRILHKYEYGPLFTPPSERGTIVLPGVGGGASWSGAAVHPDTGVLYVTSFTLPTVVRIRKPEAGSSPYPYIGVVDFGPMGPQGLPLVKPPYGRITAIDLNTGEHRWMSTIGEGPRDHPALQHLKLPPLGWPRRSFPLLTKSLLFVAQQGILRGIGLSPRRNALEVGLQTHEAVLRAFDPTTGRLIATIALPGNASGAPMTYMADGRQFIVIPIGGASQPAELVALGLPGMGEPHVLSCLVAPLAAVAQPPTHVYRIGFLSALGTTPRDSMVEAFLEGMRALGYVEGQNLVLEYRGAAGQYERFPDLAAELVRLQVDVIVTGVTPAALAAKQATTTIPIVMAGIGDPVGSGLVASLARPGGNVTGLSVLQPDVPGKQLEILKAVLPTLSRVAILWNPANPSAALMVREADVAAQRLGVQVHRVEARGPEAFDSAFAAMTGAHAEALLVVPDPMFRLHRSRLAELAATSRLPTMHNQREYVEAGGLLGYGASRPDVSRRAATYVDKILKGAKPADLPVEQPTKFELVINLKAAEALGLTIPPALLSKADEVIR